MQDKDIIGELSSLPLRVNLQIGQLEMSVKELEQLAPGIIFPLDRNIENGVDVIVNGKRIARGGIVKIGESLGIRIIQVSTDD